MDISLSTIQDLAPDQASLNAAKKLLKSAQWPMLGKAAAVHSIWGQCQGSGANPYHTMADVVDHGYKCTCPSRKFPCKHVLALLWQFAEGPQHFSESDPPPWVNDWLGRRRKGAASPAAEDDKPRVSKDIHATETAPALSEEERVRREAANARRAQKLKAATRAAIAAGLNDFEQWVGDQLRAGIGDFVNNATTRSRQMAARLVDAKAANLASRLDELPARLLAHPLERRPPWAMRELGQLIVLCEAWHSNPDDPDASRGVGATENREQLLAEAGSPRCRGTWLNVGEKVATRRDGLVSQARWLLRLDGDGPLFALLQDYFPATAGRRQAGLGLGNLIEGELLYYPSRFPQRALLLQHESKTPPADLPWPDVEADLWRQQRQYLRAIPWAEQVPCLAGEGRLLLDSEQQYWWQSNHGDNTLRMRLLNPQVNPVLLGCDTQRAFVVSHGDCAELFSAQTRAWGSIVC